MSFKVAFRHALLLASLLPAPIAERIVMNAIELDAVVDNEESKMTPTTKASTAIETERCPRLQWVKYVMSSVDDGLVNHVQDLFVATYDDVQMNFTEWNTDAAALRGNFAGLEVLCCSPCGDGVPAVSACLPLAGQVFDIRNENANKYSALFTIDSPRLADNPVVEETRKCASSMSKEEVAAFLPISDPDGSQIEKDGSKDSTLGFSYKDKPLKSNTMLFDHMYNQLSAPSGGAAQEASGKPAQVLMKKYKLHPETNFEVVKEMLGPGHWNIESPKEEGTTYTRSSWRGGNADVSENMFGAPLAAGWHWSDIDSPLRYPVKDD